MPWYPELFSAPVLARLEVERQQELKAVPFYDGLMTGELDALVESFAGVPELYHPVRGRIRGARALRTFAVETKAWLTKRNVSVEDVAHVIAPRHGFEEVVLHVDTGSGRVDLPVAVIADRHGDGRIDELRIYYSSRPLTGRRAGRPPILQPDPDLRLPGFVAEHQRALAAGDVDASVAAFEPDGSVREPAGSLHTGHNGLRAYYAQSFSGGGIELEHCALIDDKRACALEYNVSRWGSTKLPPQAGVVIYVRGRNGKLAAARSYDDVEPPGPAT